MRKLTYGAAAVLVLAGALCAVLVHGLAGELLTLVLILFVTARYLARDKVRRR